MSTMMQQQSEHVTTVRVVLDGAPFAGKTTAAHALGNALSSRAITPAEDEGRTLWFDWMSYDAGHHNGKAVRVELVTVPGQDQLADRRQHLLAWGDVVVFVADTSVSAFPGTVAKFREMRANLQDRGHVPVVVVANKRDLADAVPLETVRNELGLEDAEWLVEAIATAGGGIREAFIYAVRAGLQAPSRRAEITTAEQLLCEMQTALTPPDSTAVEPIEAGGTSTAESDEEPADLSAETHALVLEGAPDTAAVTDVEFVEIPNAGRDSVDDDVEADESLSGDKAVDGTSDADAVSSGELVDVDDADGGSSRTVVEADQSVPSDVVADESVDEALADEVVDVGVMPGDEFVEGEATALEIIEEAVAYAMAPTTPAALRAPLLNPRGVVDGAAVVILADHWQVLVEVANGVDELSFSDGTAKASAVADLVAWGLIRETARPSNNDTSPDVLDENERYRELREFRRSIEG